MLSQETQKRDLENFAKENSSVHDKVFFYPKPLLPGQDIEIFFNRSVTTLSNEPKVLIVGAFNDWSWDSFITDFQRSELSGLVNRVPKEVHQVDFMLLFFNGSEIYENNNQRDFSIVVEVGMDKQDFEDFWLEEMCREVDRLSAEEAERQRQATEQHRLEEEKAAMEADRAEAKKQGKERRDQAFQVLQKVVKSVDGLWHIDRTDFKGEDSVQLYDN